MGDQTWEEMMIGWISFSAAIDASSASAERASNDRVSN